MRRLKGRPQESLRMALRERIATSRSELVSLWQAHRRLPSSFRFLLALVSLLCFAPHSWAGTIFDFAPQNTFQLTNTNADGSVVTQSAGFILTGGNNGSVAFGTTDYTATALSSGTVNFDWSYSSCSPTNPPLCDDPTFDFAGYLIDGSFFSLADTNGQSGSGMFPITSGQSFGFRVGTVDNTGEPGILTVTSGTSVPEPGTRSMLLLAFGILAMLSSRKWRMSAIRQRIGISIGLRMTVGLLAVTSLFAQSYIGSNATGQVVLARSVNLALLTQQSQAFGFQSVGKEIPKAVPKLGLPPAPFQTLNVLPQPPMTSLPVVMANSFSFNALTHADQRNSNGGNQYSVEPPNPSIAVGTSYILEGVNNAIMVYNKMGAPQLPFVVASNQLFGVAPAINRSNNISGVFPTDMRVYYDQEIDRWFVVQRVQCCDTGGNNVHSSQIYIAVSQSGDPRGTYNIYVIDTTDGSNPNCPFGCVADYPQIGSDHYGFYVTATEYPLDFQANPSQFPTAAIVWEISKLSLSTGASMPHAYKFPMTRTDSFIFAIQPAVTPPSASFAIGNGGMEYFASTLSTGGSNVALWVMTNTSAIDNLPGMIPALTRSIASTLSYGQPTNALQKPGSLPYGSTQVPGYEAPVDGSDARALSVAYSGGRVYLAFGTQVSDTNHTNLAGAAYVIFSPTLRGSVLSANILRQGYLLVTNNNLLRPAVAVNSLGNGAIAFTLVGPDYYPSAAFVSISAFSTGSVIQIAANGFLPEDGFTGYQDSQGNPAHGVARWGDYSTAVAGSDGSIWMVTEYIPNSPRTTLANWGTALTQFTP